MQKDRDTNEEFDKEEHLEDNTDITDTADVEFVEDEEEKNPRDTIKKLREALKKVQKEKQEYLELSQRLKADSVNKRRQEEEWRKEFVKFAEEKLLIRLMPVLESFSLATANKKVWEALPSEWRVGMEYIYKELTNALSEHGLSEINPKIGEIYDPKVATSIGTVEVLDKNLDGTVAEVLQKGYSLDGKILKPARVSVAEFKVE